MILIDYDIHNFDWRIKVLYCNTDINKKILYNILDRYHINDSILNDIEYYCDKCLSNCGFTYTDTDLRETVIIIFKCSSLELLYNTCIHELYHFIKRLSILEYSTEEDQASLLGNLFMEIIYQLRNLVL